MKTENLALSAFLLVTACDPFSLGNNSPKNITVKGIHTAITSAAPYPRGDFVVSDTLRGGADSLRMNPIKCGGFFYLFHSDSGLPLSSSIRVKLCNSSNNCQDSALFQSQLMDQSVVVHFQFPREQPSCLVVCDCDPYVIVNSITARTD